MLFSFSASVSFMMRIKDHKYPHTRTDILIHAAVRRKRKRLPRPAGVDEPQTFSHKVVCAAAGNLGISPPEKKV